MKIALTKILFALTLLIAAYSCANDDDFKKPSDSATGGGGDASSGGDSYEGDIGDIDWDTANGSDDQNGGDDSGFDSDPGQVAFNQNCAECHDAITSSTSIFGNSTITAATIERANVLNAIATVDQMEDVTQNTTTLDEIIEYLNQL